MRTCILFTLLLVAACTQSPAQAIEQSDWSGGPGVAGPVVSWEDRFDSCSGASWLAVPGQVALASERLSPPLAHVLGTGTQAFGIHAADFDEDGDLDIVGAYDFLGTVVVWWNDGGNPPAFTNEVIDGTFSHPQAVFPADLDGDGDIDIVGNATGSLNRIVYWRNDGGSPVAWTRFDVDTDWPSAYELFVDDVDRDGRPDILSGSWDGEEAAWWRNGGGDPIAWTHVTVDSLLPGAHSVKSGDFDGDGDVDLVVAAGVANQIVWYRNDDGDGDAWTKNVIRENYIGARSVCVGDVDRDGDLDIAGTCWTSHVSWWKNDGGNPLSWTEQSLDTLFDGGHYVDIADLNGDGRPDILAVAYMLNDIKWWENGGGDPIVWTRLNVDRNLVGAITARAADVDGDGALEVLGAAYNGGVFVWYEIGYFAETGSLTSSVLDAGTGCPATGIDWTAEEPPGTEIRFQVRGSSDPGDLGPWSEDILTPGPFPAPLERYVQYRAFLATSDSTRSPVALSVRFARDATGVEPDGRAPRLLSLAIRPNPFNPRATIALVLNRGGHVRVSVHDIAGRQVIRLADGLMPAGPHDLTWSGTDDQGRAVPSGSYFVRVETANERRTEKLLLVR